MTAVYGAGALDVIIDKRAEIAGWRPPPTLCSLTSPTLVLTPAEKKKPTPAAEQIEPHPRPPYGYRHMRSGTRC